MPWLKVYALLLICKQLLVAAEDVTGCDEGRIAVVGAGIGGATAAYYLSLARSRDLCIDVYVPFDITDGMDNADHSL